MVKKDAKGAAPPTEKDFSSTRHSPYILLLFFFSGFVGLCYQVVWIRELSVIFGKTNAAISVVVSVFMLGLGLGSLYWGKRDITPGALSKTFARLQFGIAGGSLILLAVFPFLSDIYRGLVQGFNLPYMLILIFIFLLCAVLMFIPTFLMGGTFPVISQLYIRNDKKVGKGIGLLYGVNTFGGILGAGLTGYFLIGLAGQRETQIIGIIINLLIGAWFMKMKPLAPAKTEQTKIQKKKKKTAAKETVKNETAAGPMSTDRFRKYLIIAAFSTGFAGLAYEILWTRALSTFNSNSIYSFTGILVVFLAGIGIGSAIYTKFLANRGGQVKLFASLQFLVFLSVALTAVFLNDMPSFLAPFRSWLKEPVLRMVFPGVFLSALIMFIPTVLMGIAFPLLCKMYTGTVEHIRERIGRVFFFNTLGSMAGPVAAGFVLIPLVGVVKALIMVALINAALAFWGMVFMEKNKGKKKWTLVLTVVFLAVILLPFVLGRSFFILPPSIFRNPQADHVLKYYNETVDGTVAVVEDRNTGVRGCYVNNSAVCGVTYDALKVVHYMGQLPMMINKNAKNALVIGFGIGVTTSVVAQHPLGSIDCVEICPDVRKAAPHFEKFNLGVWKNEKINFIDGDGRNFLLLTEKKYDVISCDPVHPTLGSGSLYTEEYFRLCKDRLAPNGVICQYFPLHKLTGDDLKTLLNTFYTVFPHSMVWIAQTHGVLVGSPGEMRVSFRDIQALVGRVDDPFFKDSYLVASTFLMNRDGIKEFIGDHTKINTDNHPVLEYFSPGSVQPENHRANISRLLSGRQPVSQLLSGVPNPVLLDRYISGQDSYLQGIFYHSYGQRREAFRLLRDAYMKNPENREILMFYRYYTQRGR